MRILTAFVLMFFLAAPVFAADKTPKSEKASKTEQSQPLGGFEGPVSGADAETVGDALKLSKDARVMLKGNIISRLAGEKNWYMFKDSTGTIEIYITPKQFQGHTVKPSTNIQIIGKIDKDNPEDKARVKTRQLDILP